MTVDEAIKYVEEMVEIGETYGLDKIVEENRQLAEWLKDYKRLLEKEPCGDTISRQAALGMQYRIDDSATLSARDVVSVDDIEQLPPVKPQPKTGHWIQTNEFFINQDGQFIYKFICSECKSLSYFRKSNKKAIGANVCPNCGAKMIESQKSEDKE